MKKFSPKYTILCGYISTAKRLQSYISQNVALQKSVLLRLVPSPLKNLAMAAGFAFLGDQPYSTTLTNPGVFRVPEEMKPHIQRMEMILGQSYTPRVNCAVISYENQATIAFAGTLKETNIEREFFSAFGSGGNSGEGNFQQRGENRMSYCVNCGVELDATASVCPLCQTPVCNPRCPVNREAPCPFRGIDKR